LRTSQVKNNRAPSQEFNGYSEERMLETIRNVFRADIQTILSTIKFNVDREKMQKAGLISEEKAYRVKF